jgi:hypothetical protein
MEEEVNWLREKFSNLSIMLGLLLVLIAFILLGFGMKLFGISSDALLSLISAIIGGLIVTTSQASVSAQDRINQLRLAAIEKRLQAHQEAYTLWRKLMFTIIEHEDLSGLVLQCETWWNNNCLYLDPQSRKAFFDSYFAASQHSILFQRNDANSVMENMNRIESAGQIIVKGISLPTIGELESKFIKR